MTSGIPGKLTLHTIGSFFAILTITALAGPAATTARAQESGALIDALVRKGILASEEAAGIRAALAAENQAAAPQPPPAARRNSRVSFMSRMQFQYANLETTDRDGINSTPRVSHFLVRRFYLGVKADAGENFTLECVYDIAGEYFDRACVRWVGNIGGAPFAFDLGVRKTSFGYEEYTSSGVIKTIERSGVTRYFANEVNGRILGSTCNRVGIFADYNPAAFARKTTGFFAGAALTNPERVNTPSGIVSIGGNDTNMLALWANAGFNGKSGAASWIAGAATAYLPGQGGVNDTVGAGTRGCNLAQGSIYADLTLARLNLAAEYLLAKVDKGRDGVADATIRGFWIQPSVKFNNHWEAVVRYSHTDTDGRGIRVSDGVRSARSLGDASVTACVLHEYYIGLTYYLAGVEAKIQCGYVGGRTSGACAAGGVLNEETVSGFRTQVQVSF